MADKPLEASPQQRKQEDIQPWLPFLQHIVQQFMQVAGQRGWTPRAGESALSFQNRQKQEAGSQASVAALGPMYGPRSMERLLRAILAMGGVAQGVNQSGPMAEDNIMEFIARLAPQLSRAGNTVMGRLAVNPAVPKQIGMLLRPGIQGSTDIYSAVPSQILQLLRFLMQGKGAP